MSNVKIHSVVDGKNVTIELAAAPERNGAAMAVHHVNGSDVAQLYDVHRITDGNTPTLTGKARVFGPDPDVTVQLTTANVAVTIRGALAHNGRSVYPVSPADHAQLAAFIAAFK